MPSIGTKRIAIIGAGASGLPAIHHTKLYGCEPVCFEATDDIGGLWNYKPEETDAASVMKSTIINTSKEMTAYSDFPPAEEAANYMHNRELYGYFKSYAGHYGLMQHIRFNHKVTSVNKAPSYKEDGKWTVTYANSTGETNSEEFDGVMMCSGHHKNPNIPQFTGQENFKGEILHAHSYKTSKRFEDQKVVVLGVGNSGGDAAVELSRVTKQVYLSTRKGSWCFHRVYDQGLPLDMFLNRRSVQWLRTVIPEWIIASYLESKLNKRFDHEAYGMKPKFNCFGSHILINDDLPNRICSGTVKVVPNIREFTEKTVIFEDGTEVEADTVIFATGYFFNFDLIENGKFIPCQNNEVDLFFNMYPPEKDGPNTLATIGLIQPIGSIMPIAEIQSRVFLENLFGKNGPIIPSADKMISHIAHKKEEMWKRYVKSPRHTVQVDFSTHMKECAELIGAEPNWSQLALSDPYLAFKTFFGPTVSYIYRLNGPHQWRGAPDAIKTVDRRVMIGINKKNAAKFNNSNSGMQNSVLYLAFVGLFLVLIGMLL